MPQARKLIDKRKPDWAGYSQWPLYPFTIMKKRLQILGCLILLFSCSKEETNQASSSGDTQESKNLFLNVFTGRHYHIAFTEAESIIQSIQNDALKEECIRLRDSTNIVMNEVEEVANVLISATGGSNEYGEYNRVNERGNINEALIDTPTSQRLKHVLSSYHDYLSQFNVNLNELPIDPVKHEIISKIPEYKGQSFSEFHFKDTDLITALDALNYYKALVVNGERAAIMHLMIRELNKDETRH